MTRLLIPLVLLTSLASAAQQIPPQTGSIAGTVLDSATDQPLANARVSLFPVSRTVMTDSRGYFLIENVEPGQRRILAAATGYSAAYLTLTVTAGQRVGNTSVRMSRRGAISGRVLAPTGRPAVGASVSLLLYTFDAGHSRERARAGQANTTLHTQIFSGGSADDQGNFRIFNVDPGEYYVRIAPPQDETGNIVPALGVVLYPGVTDSSKATPIRVDAGADLQLPTVTLAPSSLGWIRVHVLDMTGEPRSPLRTEAVSVYDVSSGDLMDVARASNNLAVRPDLPGTYLVCGRISDAVTQVNNCARVVYDGSDMNLEIRIGKPDGHLSGRVLLEGTDGSSPNPFRGLRISGRIENHPDQFTVESNADGTFSPRTPGTIYSGRGKLTSFFIDRPGDYYLESARQGNRDVLREGLLIPSNAESPIEILVSAAGGILSGRVTTATGTLLPHTAVVLVPEGDLAARSDRGSTFRTAEADQNGIYEFRALVPGEYRAYAVKTLEGFAYWDNAFLSRFEENVKSIRIEKGRRVAADLKAIEWSN
jgi:hypothetical protein